MPENMHVLVVDDDKFNVALLRELCENAGYRVEEAHNGTEAMQKASQNLPGLILLDIMMVDLDGFEVCKRLRDDPATADVPIIIVTALDDLYSKVRGIEMGADDYVTKPFRIYELQERIRVALEARHWRTMLREAEERLRKLGEFDVPGRIGGFRQLRYGIEYEFNRAQRYSHPLSCSLMSINRYDEILEREGKHAAANLISAMVTNLKQHLRSVDRTYRLDAGQFIVLLPETDHKGALVALQRVREHLKVPRKEAPPITLTIALACYPHPDFKTSQEILRAVSRTEKCANQAHDCILEYDGS